MPDTDAPMPSRLERFKEASRFIDDQERRGQDLIAAAKVRRDGLLKEFRIVFVNRDPGFACWTHAELRQYFDTPEEVLAALDRKQQTKT